MTAARRLAAVAELDLALDLAARHAAAAAPEAGQIDLPRARILAATLGLLSRSHADAVAARRRREEAEREARAEHWADPEGMASLAGRGLPPAAALTASSRLTQIAAGWKQRAAAGGMDLMRAHAYLALLNGQPVDAPPAGLLPPSLCPATPARASATQPSAAGQLPASSTSRPGCAAPARAARRRPPG